MITRHILQALKYFGYTPSLIGKTSGIFPIDSTIANDDIISNVLNRLLCRQFIVTEIRVLLLVS